jgi:hypothetical protein
MKTIKYSRFLDKRKSEAANPYLALTVYVKMSVQNT